MTRPAMITRGIAFAMLALGLAAAAGTVLASEQPSITVQGNGPGWITITYTHSGTGGVLWYSVERQGGGGTKLASPNGQFIDSNLKPGTAYTYRVCAVYPDAPACSGWPTARTLPAPGKPANYDPPIITNITAAPDAIKVTWGPTGSYTKILIRLDDDLCNSDQRDLKNIANASWSFNGLRSGARYRVILKGCSGSLDGSACGAWSPDVFITTPLSPAELPPPPPPGKPTLTVTRASPTSASLEFAVKLVESSSDDRFLVYRNKEQIQVVAPRSALGGLAGSVTDDPPGQFQQFSYRVCFEAHSPNTTVCSDAVIFTSGGDAETVIDAVNNRKIKELPAPGAGQPPAQPGGLLIHKRFTPAQ